MYAHDDEEDEEMKENIDKNPLGLHQTEIIASLALDLLNESQNIINPVTNEPFKVKIGKICLYRTFYEMIFSCAKAFDKLSVIIFII